MLCRTTQKQYYSFLATSSQIQENTRRAYRVSPESISVVQEFTTTFDRSQFAEAGATLSVRIGRVDRAVPEAARRRYRDGRHLRASELVRPAGQASHLRLPRHARFPVPDDGEMPVVGKVGDNLTSYFRDIGNFEGTISDTARGGALLELEMTQQMRAKLADKLTWLEKKTKDPASISDARKTPRFVPKAALSTLTLADGTVHSCYVLDASLSGVAVATEVRPPVGMPVGIGACIGRVIRHTSEGFAVKFVKQQSRDELNGLVVQARSG
jgi:hypothetical protein